MPRVAKRALVFGDIVGHRKAMMIALGGFAALALYCWLSRRTA